MRVPSTAPPRRIGVISNPLSHANRNGRPGLPGMIARHPGLVFAEPASQAILLETLRHFAGSRIDLVVISGGDGTLRDVLTALPAAYPGGLPEIALLAAGNTNLAARALGSAGSGPAGLQRLLDAERRGRLRRTPCRFLEVNWVGAPERAPIRGLFFGAAAFAEGKRLADAEIHSRNLHNAVAVGLTAAAMLSRVLFGAATGPGRGTPMRIGVDDDAPREAPRFLLLATTLDRLMLGIWPFWGKGAGSIRWLDIEAPPRRLMAALPAMAAGRAWPWMARMGYRSGRAGRLRILLRQPFVMDGEFFDPGEEGILLTSPGQVIVVAA